MQKKIVILGATGSIGDNTLEVVRGNPERLKVVGIAGKSNYKKLAEIACEFDVKNICIFDDDAFEKALSQKEIFPSGANFFKGEEGLLEISTLPDFDTLVAAVVGTQALKPTIGAIRAGKDIALANKELLVMAGKFVMGEARKHNVKILPLDSEHNAIFQCMVGERMEDVEKLLITASGGMFRDFTLEQMKAITPEQALKHPNWNMGPKVTIDSSTLANKGLEIIEARWLFDVRPEQIQVVVQRQSLVHSMVQFKDGSVKAHISPPSMTFAISHSLLCPERGRTVVEPLDFSKPILMDFFPPDMEKFPCLAHAFFAMKSAGVATTIFNASNEVAVENFIKGKIAWLDIAKVVGSALETVPNKEPENLEDVISSDFEARIRSREIIEKIS